MRQAVPSSESKSGGTAPPAMGTSGGASGPGRKGSRDRELRGLGYDEQVAKLAPDGSRVGLGNERVAGAGLAMFRGVGGDRDGVSRGQGNGAPAGLAKPSFGGPSEESVAPTPFVPLCKEPVEPERDGATPTRADIARTQGVVKELRAAMSSHRVFLYLNYLENIRRYLGATGGDGGLALSKTDFSALGEKTVKKTILTLPGKLPVDKLLSRAMPAIATGAKLVGGAILGFLYDALVEILFDPTGKALRAAFRAGHKAGVTAMAEQAVAGLQAQIAKEGQDNMLLDELEQAALFAGSRSELEGLEIWVRQQVPILLMPVHDLSLYEQMLATWVLQRAGDEEDANKHTDGAAYEEVHKEFAKDGNLARRDLFIHQCRFEFGRLGVDAEATLASWSKKLAAQPRELELEEVIGRLGPLYLQTDRFTKPDRLSAYLGERFAWDDELDLMPSEEQVADLEQQMDESSLKQMTAHADGLPQHLARAKKNTPRFERMVASGGVRLACEVKVTDADGAIFVDEYQYRLWGTRHDAKGLPRSRGPDNLDTKAPTRTWTDSPD